VPAEFLPQLLAHDNLRRNKTLKSKKLINIITVAGACALLIFSVFVFPFILAASPDNREMETVETETTYPAEEDGQSDLALVPLYQSESEQQAESDQPESEETIIDINAISEETAIAIVLDRTSLSEATHENENGETRTHSLELRGARYFTGVDHIDAPIWRVLFYARDWARVFEYHRDGQTLEEYIAEISGKINGCCYSYSLGTDKNGEPAVIWDSVGESLFFFDVNAFTGALNGQGIVYLCDHTSKLGTFSYDETTDWNMLTEDMTYWILTDILEPDPIPVTETEN